MHVTSRSYLTAGIAALGVGAIALSPIQPIPSNLPAAHEKVVSNLAVSLASTIDPITPWVDTLKLTAENIGKLFNFYTSNPGYESPLGLTGNFSAVFPLLQTIIANQMVYFELATTGDADQIPALIEDNIRVFFNAPWDPGTCAAGCDEGETAFYDGDYISNVPITNRTPIGTLSQRDVYQALPLALSVAAPDLLATLAPVLAFTATHYSGQVAGLVGPLLAPVIALTRSFTAVGALFEAGDVVGAINELINIPANVTNGVLNGAGYLDLTSVANAIAPLPDAIKSIGLNLGGLVSPPVPFEGTLDAPTELSGGTLFDNIATEAGVDVPFLGTVSVKTPGLPVSWFGSVIGLGQFLSEEMLWVLDPGTTAAAAPAPAATTPAVPATPAVAATPAVPATDEALAIPAVPADPADPATPAVPDASDAVEVEAPAAPAGDRADAASDNSGNHNAGKASSRASRHGRG